MITGGGRSTSEADPDLAPETMRGSSYTGPAEIEAMSDKEMDAWVATLDREPTQDELNRLDARLNELGIPRVPR
jgi:hypothetical protein